MGAAGLAAGASLDLPGRADPDPPPARLRLIDTHHHIFPSFYVDAIGLDAASSHTGRLPKWSPESSLEIMDAHGIEWAVVSISNPGVTVKNVSQPARLARQCNEFARQMIVDHPGRFDAFAVLPMPDVTASLAEAKYALEDLKFAGIGLLTNYDGVYLGNPQFEPLLADLARRKAVVFVHPAESASAPLHALVPPPVIEFPHDTTWAIANLLYHGVFSKYPAIRFIFSHAGGTLLSIGTRFQIKEVPPTGDPMPLLKRQHFDLALSTNPITVPALLAFAGYAHVVFGSDYPFVSEPALRAGVEYLAGLARGNPDFHLVERDTLLSFFPQFRR